eukprot:CAMPEP_0201506528 /NCGR_PEP_ID=MMETSP0161_2-20130828/458_1 /ASSEMBLY_ACC=CAM_ASM_000251 /TAXON_ID=180227 /ORGANISM="Neoparamoeba aestuarina, Strain SoJaBio B1-5/56/2" /LENGTH=235 /DNA_ID=CAMNT_0047900645 /DNA_START=129 /DNA_END=836 /DNA_ORIENTATION=-
MALVYGLVARGSVVLAEFADTELAGGAGLPEASKVARYILQEKVTDNPIPHKKSFGHERHNFYYKVDDHGLCYLVVAQMEGKGEAPSMRIPYQCIEEIASEFLAKCGSVYADAPQNGLNDIFSREIGEKLTLWNDPNADAVGKTKTQVGVVKNQMIDNIDKVVQRGEALDSLEERTILLSDESAEYSMNVKTMQRKIWWKQKKCQVIMCVTCIIVTIVLIVLIIVGAHLAASSGF